MNLGAGRTATALAAGDFHTCAIGDDGGVRCWGFGGDGRLGYGNTNNVLDPSSAGAVNLGAGHTAKAITAGAAHTCAILDDGTVRCWGFGGGGGQDNDGRLGYGNHSNVGDIPADTPNTAGPVNLGSGRTAVAISAGGAHTCAILDDGSVRCWGFGAHGELGYGNTNDIGATPTTTPDTAGPVSLGAGRTAMAIAAGDQHTCAILDDGSVRCWGFGLYGQVGYGNTSDVGEAPTDTPGLVGPVNLGGHKALAITAGNEYTCAIIDDGTVRCWGLATRGRLGYPTLDSLGNQPSVLDPSSVGPVDLGAGRTAVAISAGGAHTCALLDNGTTRCWGYGIYGELGYCNTASVGLSNTPGSVGPVNLQPGDGGALCPAAVPAGSGAPPATVISPVTTPTGIVEANPLVLALRAQGLRALGYRRCLASAARQPKRWQTRARRACVKRYARTPGNVTGLNARALLPTKVVLSFAATGSSGTGPPAARGYLIKQSQEPIRSARSFHAAHSLCNGTCRFAVTVVGTKIVLAITHLRPHGVYFYAVAARDNVTGKLGPRSREAEVRTR